MNYFDKEINILNQFRNMFLKRETLLLPKSKEVKHLLKTIIKNEFWEEWIDSSGNSESPPDFTIQAVN